MNQPGHTADTGRSWGANEFPPLETLWPAIEGRFGVLPSFFKLARSEPPIAWMLFRMAEFAYQDNPLPSLFKEQLFTYLSRFCEVRYCVARHCAFLMGNGYAAGDPTSRFLTADEVLTILKEPLPLETELPGLRTAFVDLPPIAEGEWPDFFSQTGRLLHIACATVFLQPSKATGWLAGLKQLTGDARYEQLMLLIAFIRMAHFWTHVHPELAFEEDLESLLREHSVLIEPLLSNSEAAQWAMGVQLFEELESLRANQAEFRLAAIVESSDDAIVSKDLDGVIKSWNQGAERIFGYTAEEVIGRSIRLIIPADRQNEEDEVLARIRNGERVEHFETKRMRKDGTLVDISLSVSPIRDGSGQVIGASKIARDITERKMAEEAMKAAAAQKDQFLSLVSHELRTPVTTILANALILRRRGDTLAFEDRDQALQDVASEAQRLQSVIENLLLLTRIESSQGLDLERVSLNDLVSSQITTFIRRKPSRTVEFSSDGRDIESRLSKQSIEMALENLLTNADKYSPPETSIEVFLRRDPEGMAEVTVRDSGIGVDESEAPKLFTPFYRSAAAQGYAPGMGLGLAVCKRIIEAHGGRIWVTRRPEGGSEFRFILPASSAGPIAGPT